MNSSCGKHKGIRLNNNSSCPMCLKEHNHKLSKEENHLIDEWMNKEKVEAGKE